MILRPENTHRPQSGLNQQNFGHEQNLLPRNQGDKRIQVHIKWKCVWVTITFSRVRISMTTMSAVVDGNAIV